MSGSIRCGVYAVGYFDLCGQSNALRKYIAVNSAVGQTDAIQKDFSVIASQIHNFRNDIRKYFNAAREERLADSVPAGAPTGALAAAAELDSAEIKLQGFSDSVVAYVPLAPSQGRASIYPIAAMLISVASTMLTSLARGSVVRGAIDVSWAMEAFNGEVYGPALLSAYELECRFANWPRVVLGDGIKSVWNAYKSHRPETPFDAMNRILAEMQSSVTFEDVDGQFAVDYLGEGMAKFIDSPTVDLPPLVDAAHAAIEAMLREYAGDSKIEGKLHHLHDYFIARKGPLTDDRRKRAAGFYTSGSAGRGIADRLSNSD
jgi:hypothetical protein